MTTQALDDLKYWYLRDHKLFWVLNNSQIRQLCIITNYKKAKKGEIIDFGEHDKSRIFFLKKGHLKIVEMDDNGNELIKDVIQKGDLFGELGFDNGNNSKEYAQALTDQVILCSFNTSDFERLLQEHPSLAITYTKFVGFQLKRIKNNYSNLFFKSARQRLVTFLKNWADREGVAVENGVKLSNYLTQQEVAQIICTSRQTATQIFNEWEQAGVLTYARKEIIIHDFTKLV